MIYIMMKDFTFCHMHPFICVGLEVCGGRQVKEVQFYFFFFVFSLKVDLDGKRIMIVVFKFPNGKFKSIWWMPWF